MKKLVLMVALLTLVAFASGVMAQPKPAPAPAPASPAPAAPAPEKAKAPEKPKAEKLLKFTGVVEKVDEMAKAIVIKGKKESLTFATDDKTKITRGKDTMSLADVKSGMNVTIDYKKDGGKNIASAIKLATPKAPPAAKAPPAEKKEKPAEPPKK